MKSTERESTPAGFRAIPRLQLTRRKMLAYAAKIGVATTAIPAALVGLDVTPAPASPKSLDCVTRTKMNDECYQSCIGQCSDAYSGCNSSSRYQPYNTCTCENGAGTGTPVKAAASCIASTGTGYCCCIYC